MTALYLNQSLRDLEQRLYAQAQCQSMQLMENAGQAALDCLCTQWPDAQHIVVCCGGGNNGGDGWVLARLALQQGKQVIVYSTVAIDAYHDDAAIAVERALAAGVTWQLYPIEDPEFSNILHAADVVVDALLGSGLQGHVREPYTSFIQTINQSHSAVLAIDVPSGVDSDTGQVVDNAVHADITVTFIALKRGLLTGHAPAYCGKIISHSIGVPEVELNKVQPAAYQLTKQIIGSFLSRRSRTANKSDYGHVLVVGGDYGMGGAVRMAAEAAMRVGAGLVSVATRPEHVCIVNSTRPEIMCHQISTSKDLIPLLARASIIVVGPGLGTSEWAHALLATVLQQNVPKVIDADALNILAQHPQRHEHWVLTPHPGEAGRLLGISNQDVQKNRFSAVEALQKRYGGVVVLKGAGTLIQAPEKMPTICCAGNPGMASGGMGDILSGVIGGLLAQHLHLEQAAQIGVMSHALAADKAAAVGGGERGLLACDLLTYLREFVNPMGKKPNALS